MFRFLRHATPLNPAPLFFVVAISACSSEPDTGGDTTSNASASSGGGAGGNASTTSSNGSTTSSDTAAVSGAGGAGGDGAGGGGDACSVDGNPGDCVDVSACAALADHTSVPGYCAGPDNIQCCVKTPDVADNPPIPNGYKLMMQDEVTSEMTTWAVDILNDPMGYPMFSTAMQTFGTLMVLARVEWHPPDFQNSVVHRGVTLYEPI